MSDQRKSIFEEAESLIKGNRRDAYGGVQESFMNIAAVWSVVLKTPVTAQQVAKCMLGMKLVREANKHQRDNLVDLCGYSMLLQQLEEGDQFDAKPSA